MAVKAVNNTAGPDGLVPTLLVYGAYLRISNLDPPALSITEQAAIIWKAIAEIVKLRAKQAYTTSRLILKSSYSEKAVIRLDLTVY